MKKFLTHLTGIVFLIALLVAGGCSPSPKTDTNGDPGLIPPAENKDPEGIDIFLRAVLIDDARHLEMYESRKEDCPVIDGLITEVNPYDTVYWKKATASKIKEVTLIRLMTAEYKFNDNSVEKIEDEDKNYIWKFIVPDFDDADTIKYEIHFTVDGNDKDTTIIDPYLKLPKQL